MGSQGDAVVESTLPQPATYAFDLFVIYATDDTEFVRGYLLPALNLPAQRVLLVDELPLGAVIASEIDRGVSTSRFTLVVLSPAYLKDRWAVFGERLAIPAQRFPLRLRGRRALHPSSRSPSAAWSSTAPHSARTAHASSRQTRTRQHVYGMP